jgi:hypothetical protein
MKLHLGHGLQLDLKALVINALSAFSEETLYQTFLFGAKKISA